MLEINIIKFTSQKPNYCKPRKVYLGKKALSTRCVRLRTQRVLNAFCYDCMGTYRMRFIVSEQQLLTVWAVIAPTLHPEGRKKE